MTASICLRRYCYEEEFRKAAPRQCDEGVRQQSDSGKSHLSNGPIGADRKKPITARHGCAPTNGGKFMNMMKNLKRSMTKIGEMVAVIGHNM